MKTGTIALEKCSESSEREPSIRVAACDDGYSVSVWDEWGGESFVALSFEEAEKLARLFTQHILRQ